MAGKKLAEYNRRKKEELKEQKKNERESENSAVTSTQCYGIGAIVVGGAIIIIIGYQVWKSKRGAESFTHNPVIHNPTTQKPQNQLRKLEME